MEFFCGRSATERPLGSICEEKGMSSRFRFLSCRNMTYAVESDINPIPSFLPLAVSVYIEIG